MNRAWFEEKLGEIVAATLRDDSDGIIAARDAILAEFDLIVNCPTCGHDARTWSCAECGTSVARPDMVNCPYCGVVLHDACYDDHMQESAECAAEQETCDGLMVNGTCYECGNPFSESDSVIACRMCGAETHFDCMQSHLNGHDAGEED